MTTKPAHIVFGAVGLAVGVFGVWALREATLSTHGRVDPSTQIELVVRARTEGGERGQTLDEMVEALLLTCRLEVTSDIAGPIRARGQRAATGSCSQPALDQTDRRQLRGCLEDWTIDHLLVDVVAFETPR